MFRKSLSAGRMLSAAAAVCMAFVLAVLAKSVPAYAGHVTEAAEDIFYKNYTYEDNREWKIEDAITNINVTFLDYEQEVDFSFDLTSLPSGYCDADNCYTAYLFAEIPPTIKAELSTSLSEFPATSINTDYFRYYGNSGYIWFDKDACFNRYSSLVRTVGDKEELDMIFCIARMVSHGGFNWEDVPVYTVPFKISRDRVKTAEEIAEEQEKSPTTENWILKEMISDVRLAQDTFTLGSAQSVVVKFKNKKTHVPDPTYGTEYLLYARVLDEDGNIIAEESVSPETDLKVGENQITVKVHFSERGRYYVKLVQQKRYRWDDSIEDETSSIPITVKRATDDNGNVISTGDSVKTAYSVYTKAQAKNFKVTYTVSDISCDYHLYIIYGPSTYYNYDKKSFLPNADFMSMLDELPLKLGKENELTVNTEFKTNGYYTVVLYNTTLNQKAAECGFYVVPEKYMIQRDMSKMSDGIVPFTCEGKLMNMDLDKDKSVTFKVAFPINMQKYMYELETTYGSASLYEYDDYFGEDEDYARSYCALFNRGSDDDFSVSDAFFKDDYTALVSIYYTPVGSKKSRLIHTDAIKGMYAPHTIKFTAEELMSYIYETKAGDTSISGVITVEFSNDPLSDSWQDNHFHEDVYNESIVTFTDSFSFGITRAPQIKSAKASSKNVERAYGEYASFIVDNVAGGKIYAVIYKGKKKIATVTTDSVINEDGTGSGIVYWNLQNKNGKYAATGSYKAKIYTAVDTVVVGADGKQSKKTVKSKTKSVSFKLVKPTESLSLSASVIGSSGEKYVYIEEAIAGVNTNLTVGSDISVTIQNSSGSTVKTLSYTCGKGSATYWFNLGSGLKAGSYKATVKAKTIDGATKTATASFEVKKMPKAEIKNVSVSADSNTGLGSVSFNTTQFSKVTVTVKSGSTTKQTVIDQSYSAGKIATSFSIGGYAVGTYNVVITATNSGGTATITKSFEVKKKPVVVKKPTISNLNFKYGVGKDGDTYSGTFNYTGKGAKVVVDIMYNDTEEIVYTYEGKTTKDSGTFTYTWDGFKSNGFRAWTGNYTMRVYLVNSAGKTEYLRRNFTISEG